MLSFFDTLGLKKKKVAPHAVVTVKEVPPIPPRVLTPKP